MLQTAPISLEAAGTAWLLDSTPGSLYRIRIAPGTLIAICFGEDARKPASKFRHPNLVLARNRLHEFKHDRSGGGKYWTARPGVDLWFIFPKAAVTLLPEKGLSYVKTLIGGVNVTLNVSGGAGTEAGWSDLIDERVQASVGHSMKDLARIAAVAVRDTEAEKALVAHLAQDVMDERDAGRFQRLLAATSVQPAFVAKYRAGTKGLKIQLSEGYADSETAGVIEEIQFCHSMVWRKPTAEQAISQPNISRFGCSQDTARVRRYVARFGSGRVFRVSAKQIDWVRTAELNEISLS